MRQQPQQSQIPRGPHLCLLPAPAWDVNQPSTWHPEHQEACHWTHWGGGIFLLCFPEIPLSLMLLASSCHMQGTLHGLKRRMKEGRVLKDGEERRGDTEDLEAPWRRQDRQQVEWLAQRHRIRRCWCEPSLLQRRPLDAVRQ